MQGLCRYESLVTPGLSLLDFARMNDAISVRDENERRYRELKD